jgi:hypothetical protein
VLAATNRPYDVDEAILRRLPQTFEVPLPDVEQRASILEVLVRDEPLADGFCARKPDAPLMQLAAKTEGFSGSDLQVHVSTFRYPHRFEGACCPTPMRRAGGSRADVDRISRLARHRLGNNPLMGEALAPQFPTEAVSEASTPRNRQPKTSVVSVPLLGVSCVS